MPSFFNSIGLGSEGFTYQTLANTLAVVGCTACVLLVDKVGRRPILIVGTFLCIVFNIVIAACGSKNPPSGTETRSVVASFILLLGASRGSLGSLACKFTSLFVNYG
jgi:MFS family permease